MKELGRILENFVQEAGELETQVQTFQQEILQMRRDNEVEINKLTADLGARVSVEVEAAPSTDLSQILLNIREEYENLMARNLKEAENMFLERSQELTQQVSSGSEQMQSAQTNIIDLRHSLQTLEIELQSEQNMTSALEGILEETKSSYAFHLSKLQKSINNVEGILAQIRSDLESQNQEYHRLMDQKTHLELEIATYQRLLDGNDIQVIESPLDNEKHEEHKEEKDPETQSQGSK
ncbi:keratin, type I cuticular Ha6-like [Spea bombifrons]|uniref:keratin, type I cuticular Ha6-like n=1 Tax=Spea bombifrons TaxID=233779 RepID=UPI0023495F1F|nr:keratin, type I cuticular Ha6-like [Spea bombifrons]